MSRNFRNIIHVRHTLSYNLPINGNLLQTRYVKQIEEMKKVDSMR